MDRTGPRAGGVGGMADSYRGDSRREGPLRPPRADRRGTGQGREGGEQEPVVPASQGDGVKTSTRTWSYVSMKPHVLKGYMEYETTDTPFRGTVP